MLQINVKLGYNGHNYPISHMRRTQVNYYLNCLVIVVPKIVTF